MSSYPVLNTAFAIFTLLSFALTLWRWAVACRFPLHRRFSNGVRNTETVPSNPAAGVTLVKPLKGVEPDTKRCLRSWFEQEYPGPIQILFGVASAEDPVCTVARELFAEFPKIDAQLIICDKSLAPNRKVSTLMQLESRIRHALVAVSDADVSVPPEFLANITPLLADPGVGLVNCFYRIANPSTMAMKWEALAVNSDFWSQVLQARSLKEVDFGLGAVMTLPRTRLQSIGGFASLAPFLADDYQLGQHVVRSGGRIVFATVVVDCWEATRTWRQAWAHQLRWARTIRVCQPLPFFMSVLNNATLWPVLWMLATLLPKGLSGSPLLLPGSGVSAAWVVSGFCLLFRCVTALDQQRRLTVSKFNIAHAWMVPIKDLMDAAIWAMSFLGSRIEWSGESYRVVAGGKLVK